MLKLEKIALAIFGFIAFSYIISAAYFAIGEFHPVRQSDAYGHILGFMGFKDFVPYDRFHVNNRTIFDIPIYQWIIAKISLLIDQSPLVVIRFANLFFWSGAAVSGYQLCRILGKAAAGAIFVFLIATSPLFLYYYSVALPDTMAIACSLVGILMLYRYGMNWKSALYALPFLAIATFIKSPIPFIFVVFYITYITLNINIKDLIKRATLAQYIPIIIMLIVILCLAILAEQLRAILLSREGQGFTDNPYHYFGDWNMRTSAEFWQGIQFRFHSFSAGKFGNIYILVVVTACLIKREKQHIILTVSAIVAFLSGWLIFSNVYKLHDYYQLPVAVIVFISFAVSLSHIFAFIMDKAPTRHQTNLAKIGIIVMIFFSIFQTLTQNGPTDRIPERDLYAGINYALRDHSVFLYVRDPNTPDNGIDYGWDLITSAKVSTQSKDILKKEFEDNCDDYISKYSAIISRTYSKCLELHKKNAEQFIEYNRGIFYLKSGKTIYSKRDIAARAEPILKSTFKVYIDKNQLVYVKESCTKADIKAFFFVRIAPQDENQLSSEQKKHGVAFLDFIFLNQGQIIDGTCIAVRDLPSYKIKQITTGQYIPATGQRVWEGVISLDSIRKVLTTSKLDIASRATPVLDSTFKVYIEDDHLVYIKKSCTEADTKAIFFVHIAPQDENQLSSEQRKHGVAFLDFIFSHHGQIIDGTCIAVRDLPSYKIKLINVGQFIPATGQRVWEGVINPDSIK